MSIKLDYKSAADNDQEMRQRNIDAEYRVRKQGVRDIIEAIIAFTIFGYMVAYAIFMFVTGG
jgi:hypothetical protein